MRKIVSLLFILIVFVKGQTADSLYQSAFNAIKKEHYQIAADYYHQILAQGIEHTDLYYNLGNSYYRTGKIGYAVWAYEKGLQLSPRDEDIQFNLKIANNHVRDRIENPKSIFIVEWYRTLKNAFILEDILFFGGGLLLFAALMFVSSVWITFRYRSRLISIAVGLSVVVHLIAIDKYWDLSDIHEGVITSKEIKVFSSPFEREDGVLFRLHEGIKVQITQSQSQWMEISLLDGKKGWISSNHLREL